MTKAQKPEDKRTFREAKSARKLNAFYILLNIFSPPKFDYFFKTQNLRESTDKKTSREIFEILKVRSKMRFNFFPCMVTYLIVGNFLYMTSHIKNG